MAASSPKMPANTHYQIDTWARGGGPDTAQYGGVWPNAWPNGEIRPRDQEGTSRARDDRDRSRALRGRASPNRRHKRGTAIAMGGALSVELDASWPADSQSRMIAARHSTTDHVGDQRQRESREHADPGVQAPAAPGLAHVVSRQQHHEHTPPRSRSRMPSTSTRRPPDAWCSTTRPDAGLRTSASSSREPTPRCAGSRPR